MTSRWRRAWRELVRSDDQPRGRMPVVTPEAAAEAWRRAQDWSIDWRVHLEEGELRLELARERMRASVLREESGRHDVAAPGLRGVGRSDLTAPGSGERGAE